MCRMTGLATILDENARLRAALEAERAGAQQLARQFAEQIAARDAQITAQTEQVAIQDSLLAARARQLSALSTQIATQSQQLALRDAQIAELREFAERAAQKLELLARKASGPASQRYIPERQVPLPLLTEQRPPPRLPRPELPEATERPDTDRARPRPRRRDRASFAHLPARPVRCRASAEAACARCGGPLRVIGQAESFRVEWVPGHFVVEDVSRDKCACSACPGEGVLTVPGPYALDRALCGNGLLARVVVDKFADHLPLNRQAQRMAREGLDVTSGTLASWVLAAAELLRPLATAVQRQILAESTILADDTGLPVQDGDEGALRKGRLWAFTDQAQVRYVFTDTKHGKHPEQFLQEYKGKVLLVDGGSEFNQAVRTHGLERAGCWSHLRTWFFDARHHHPEEAAVALGHVRLLFLTERQGLGLPPDQLLALRQSCSAPVVDAFFGWVRRMQPHVRPTSKLAEALRYALNQEPALRLFLQHGRLPLHNNLSELLLRQAVVGRKNWLFARSEGGAAAAADLYTLIGSCLLQGIDPHAYLVDVLARLPDHPVNQVGQLTPSAWRECHTVGRG